MSGKAKPAQRLNAQQARGVDASRNAWMSASAGTGKTEVLTSRILNLLLAGAPPQSILAITFTRAGAGEMARRIRERLASWVMMPDGDLISQLHAIHTPNHSDPAVRNRARSLFARVIDAPGGGPAIMTIHAFCQSLLASFPEEAGLAPGFAVIDDRDNARLRATVLSDLVEGARDRGDGALLDRLEALALAAGEMGTQNFLARCAERGSTLTQFQDPLRSWVRAQLGLAREGRGIDWLIETCSLAHLLDDDFDIVVAGLRKWNRATGDKNLERIIAWRAAEPSVRAATINDVILGFLTAQDKFQAVYTKNVPDLAEPAERLSKRLCDWRNEARDMDTADRIADALTVGRWYAAAIETAKRRTGRVSYADLIERTAHLLSSDAALWIRYKLDQRIDHILVDEAQDTNRQQWDIVKGLTEEFFAGDGARADVVRTLFAVGDTKQAIFGFQGTSPKAFAEAFIELSERAEQANHPIDSVPIDINFRSSRGVLALVDTVIEAIGPARLGLDAPRVSHIAHHGDAPATLIALPLEPKSADDSDVGDDGAFAGDFSSGEVDEGEEKFIDKATRRLAARIAKLARHWIDHGLDGQPVSPGDILVLVRRRTDLAGLIVARLQSERVPVAGVDRLQLSQPLAVQDVLAAMRFALQPHDDLNLACLLTSPLMGWSHADLEVRGWRMDAEGRFPVSLWTHLNRDDAVRALLGPLRDLLNLAGYAGPHAFIETILSGPLRGREKLIARLGDAASDPVEELVSQALDYGTRFGPSLAGFLDWFDGVDQEVKREAEAAGDAVRVMTVHGSKGLQAPIVIIADAAGDPKQRGGGDIDWSVGDDVKTALDLPLPAFPKQKWPAAIEAQKKAAEDDDLQEHFRLMYVAMTRAERVLCVAGTAPKPKKDGEPGTMPENNWYTPVRAAIADMGGTEQPIGDIWPNALIWHESGAAKSAAPQAEAAALDVPDALPDWVDRPPAPESRPPRPLAPSSEVDLAELSVAKTPGAARDVAMQRGTLVHQLFERLPSVAVERRRDAALTWLAVQAPAMDESVHAAMADSVLAVLADPAHAALFGPQSLAEVPFSALVDGRVIAGSVDRLVVDGDRVLVVDFKSGQSVPASADLIPDGYLRQMAAYRAALRVIFAGKQVTAALLFSEGPRFFALDDALLDRHKP